MNENVFFQFADCVGEALARRWLAQRARPGQQIGGSVKLRGVRRDRAASKQPRDCALQAPSTRAK